MRTESFFVRRVGPSVKGVVFLGEELSFYETSFFCGVIFCGVFFLWDELSSR